MVDKKLTGAHYGLHSWLVQRITAIIILLFTIALVVTLIILPNDYESLRIFFSYNIVKILTQITFIAVIMHAWVGVRDILMDYIKPSSIRLLMHVLTILWLISTLIYSIIIIWSK